MQKRIIYSRNSGLLSYNIDGFEDKLVPEKLSEISLKKFDKISQDYKTNREDDYLKKGKPLYRLVDNTTMYLLIKIVKTEAERCWINETVFVSDSNNDDNLLKAKIKDIIDGEKSSFLVLELKRFIDRWLNLRKKDLQFVKNIYRGIIVPNKAVFPTHNGYKVVTVTPGNDKKLKDIEIVFKGDKNMIVEGLEVGEKIVVNPAEKNYYNRRSK